MSMIVPEVGSYLRCGNTIFVINSVVPDMSIEGWRRYIGDCELVDQGANRRGRYRRFTSRADGIFVSDDLFDVGSSFKEKYEYIDKFEHEVLKLGDISGSAV